MSDFYSFIKPALNKLSELNVWDSLFVIRQYLTDAVRNYNLDIPHFERIENHQVCSIPLYIIDFMIFNTFYHYLTKTCILMSFQEEKKRKDYRATALRATKTITKTPGTGHRPVLED